MERRCAWTRSKRRCAWTRSKLGLDRSVADLGLLSAPSQAANRTVNVIRR